MYTELSGSVWKGSKYNLFFQMYSFTEMAFGYKDAYLNTHVCERGVSDELNASKSFCLTRSRNRWIRISFFMKTSRTAHVLLITR